MNQDRVNKLALSQYFPLYQQLAEHTATKQLCLKIASEERARGLDQTQTMRGVRSRIHEMLQVYAPVPDPEIKPTSNATQARLSLDDHHEQQTAHFQALWHHADALALEAMGDKAIKGAKS
jgi:hypothetical protein